jgi:hypothetical protein
MHVFSFLVKKCMCIDVADRWASSAPGTWEDPCTAGMDTDEWGEVILLLLKIRRINFFSSLLISFQKITSFFSKIRRVLHHFIKTSDD